MNIVLEHGGEDLHDDGENWEILTDTSAYEDVLEAVKKAGIEPVSASVSHDSADLRQAGRLGRQHHDPPDGSARRSGRRAERALELRHRSENCWKKLRDSFSARSENVHSRPGFGRLFALVLLSRRGCAMPSICAPKFSTRSWKIAVEKGRGIFVSDSARDASTLCTGARAGTFVVELGGENNFLKVRLDKLLVDRGLAASRERAQALILAGKVLVDDQKVEKAGAQVSRGVRDPLARRRSEVCQPRRTEAGAGARTLEDRSRGQNLSGCGGVDRRVYRLPACSAAPRR